MKKTAASKGVGRMSGLDLHGWELIMVVSLGIGAIAAAAVVVSTQIVIKLQRLDAKEKADAFAQYKIEVGKQTDQLKKDTAEATARALEAQLALAKFKAPRTLTPEQSGRIVDKLKQFVGTEYDIAVSEPDPEILSLVLTFKLVLSTAGWIELDWKGNGEGFIREGMLIIRLGAAVTNVIIGVHVSEPIKLFELALALSAALTAEGVDATAEKHIPHAMSSTNANAIHIFIGRKS